MKKSITKNYIYNLIYQVLSMILPLITTPYLSRVLGAEPIGIYGYTISIVTYFILFGSLGIAMFGQREIAYVQNDKKKLSKTFWEIQIIKSISIPISMIIFFIFFCLKGDYQIYYRILLIYMVANILDISWFFQGIEEFGKTVIRNTIVKLISLILIFVCVRQSTDLWKYILIFVGSEALGNATMWMYLPKYIEKIKIKTLNLKRHIKPTIALFIPQIATQIYTVLDKTMVGVLTNDMNEVGYYEQAQKVVKVALTILTSFGTVMSTRIAVLFAENKKDEIYSNLKSSFQFIWFLSVPMMFGLIAISNKFVPWFYGEEFYSIIPILCITTPILVAIGLNNIIGVQYLIQVGKQNKFTIAVTIGAIANVILNFLLIPKFKAIGASVASVLSEIVILIVEIWYTKNEICIKDMITTSFKYLISGIVMFIVIYCMELYLNVSIINTIICVITGAIIYFVMLILLKDELLKEKLKQFEAKIKNINR